MKKRAYILFLLVSVLFCTETFSQLQQAPNSPPKKTRILFLLDGSGSMNASWEGRTRMEIAKDLLYKIVDSLATLPDISLGLRVYGHQYGKQYGNCADTKLEAPFASNNKQYLKQKLYDIKPKGVTPIAYSLEQAAYDFPESDKYRNIIIIITDGLESCNGDPCRVSKALQEKHIFLSPYIVGIGLDQDLTQHFSCVGKFYNASTVKTFDAVMRSIIKQTTADGYLRVDLLDSNGKPTETNVNMSFLNAMTDMVEYDFVHKIGADGKSNKIKIDPVLRYDIQVNTIPKVVKRNVTFDPDKENIVQINAPQGQLQVYMSGYREYDNLQVLIKHPKTGNIIHMMPINQIENLLVGTYDIEVLTIPRTQINNVRISQSQTNKLDIVSPGRFSIGETRAGYGSLYKINKDGTEEWFMNLDEKSAQINLAMQPGEYKLVFRDQQALSSENTYVKRFTIRQGGSTSLRLYH